MLMGQDQWPFGAGTKDDTPTLQGG